MGVDYIHISRKSDKTFRLIHLHFWVNPKRDSFPLLVLHRSYVVTLNFDIIYYVKSLNTHRRAWNMLICTAPKTKEAVMVHM